MDERTLFVAEHMGTDKLLYFPDFLTAVAGIRTPDQLEELQRSVLREYIARLRANGYRKRQAKKVAMGRGGRPGGPVCAEFRKVAMHLCAAWTTMYTRMKMREIGFARQLFMPQMERIYEHGIDYAKRKYPGSQPGV